MNLLIVDDDAINRKLLRAQLEAEGHSVVDAVDGIEALKVLVREVPIDGIVSDILMPDMDGFQLCLEVRKNNKTASLPFIFYTSTYSSPQDQQLAKTVGGDSYLSKPSPTPVILAALHEAAQRTRPRIAAAAAQQDETYVLKQYNAALVRKLEQRNIELEQALKDIQGAHDAVEASEERFRQITETIREVFWLTNPAKNEMLYISPAYDSIWGRPRVALYKSPKAWVDAIHPEDRERVLNAAIKDQIAGTYNQEYRIVRPDDTLRWIHDRAFPVRNAKGEVYRVAGVAEDITERKLQERKIEKLTRVRTITSEINAVIVRARDRKSLFQDACRIAVEHGGFGIAWIGSYDPNAMEVTPVAWAGIEAQSLAASKSNLELSERKRSVLARAFQERQAAINNDITVNPHEGGARRQEAIRRGYRSAIVMPLVVEGGLVGNFSLFVKELNFFDEEEVALLNELAANLSLALELMARRERIEKLSRIRDFSSEINAAQVRIRERETLLQETCRIAAKHGKFEMIWIGAIDEEKQEVRAVAWEGFSAETANKVSWKSISAAQGALGEAIRTRKLAVRNNIEAQLPVGGMRGEAVQRGYRSNVCMPIVVNDRTVALVVLFSAGTDFFDVDELSLLNELAADVSFGLQSIAQQEKVQYLSYYDTVTGLPNRILFIDRTSQQLRGRGGEKPVVTMILLNLERFRNINETFGRHGGDDLLKQVAHRLEAAFNGRDYLARIGADSFGAVVRGIHDPTATMHIVQEQVLGCFRTPFALDSREIRVAAKVGAAIYPADGADADTLFKNAEAALKMARESNERYLFYAADMNAKAAQILSLETRLRKAVEAEQFVLHYQPKFRLADGKMAGLEALIRWNEPGIGLVPPGAFISVLEDTGLILEVGRWALTRALMQHREWSARGRDVPRIAVNVSPIQLQQKDFSDVVIDAVQAQGDIPDALELEVTESLLMKDVQASIRKLSILRGMGITIAMDDFGTGYSSLAYIARLPISSIKIDRSFVNAMTGSPQDMGIVTTVIALAHSMNLKIVAEGVETEEQSHLLRLLKCDEAQGYLFSKPLPPGDVEALLPEKTR